MNNELVAGEEPMLNMVDHSASDTPSPSADYNTTILSSVVRDTAPGRLKILKAPALSTLGISDRILMLDCGAQASCITQSALQGLKHKPLQDKIINVLGIGGRCTTKNFKTVEIYLQPPSPLDTIPIKCLVFDDFVAPFSVPPLSEEDKAFASANKLVLNTVSGQIRPDILIGVSPYHKIASDNASSLPSGLNIAQTVFGNVVSGEATDPSVSTNSFACLAFATTTATEVADPFGFDAQGIKDDPSPSADDDINEMVIKRVRQEAEIINGNIYLKFPWREDHPPVDNNEKLAYCRLHSQYDKLHGNKVLWDQYHKNFMDQLEAGIIEPAPPIKSKTRPYYVIPHQAVLKLSSLTTKLRTVLDASSHRNGSASLNDAIHQGPTILPDLLGVIMRMREHNFLITSDIEKAFHQVFLAPSERDSCTIMWLKDHNLPPSDDNLIFYRYTRLPFGVNASPFLLAIAITILLEKMEHPLKDKIIRDMYVDNLFMGTKTSEEAESIYTELKMLFNKMKMNLREFTTSCPRVRDIFEPGDQTSSPISAKLLGTPWDTEQDTITIPFKPPSITGKYTKRSLLSAYAATFDPLGLLAPVLVPFKIILSEIFRLPGGWDDKVPDKYIPTWDKCVADTNGLESTFPRKVTSSADPSASCSLAIFADASSVAFGIATYLITTHTSGKATTSELLVAKSRVVTIGSTIPRSELVAIYTAVKMAETICSEMDTDFKNIYILSDSMIALQWIKKTEDLKTFVNNRVKATRTIVENLQNQTRKVEFLHTRTDENPADATSRGLTSSEFSAYFWKHGPSWLLRPRDKWPVDCLNFSLPSELQRAYEEEVKPRSIILCPASVSTKYNDGSCVPFYTKDLSRLEGIILKIARFFLHKIRKLKKGSARDRWIKWLPILGVYKNGVRDHATSVELKNLLTFEHQKVMADDIKKFELSQDVSPDHRNILRYRGRIGASSGEPDPALLSSNHPFSDMMIQAAHLDCMHGGDDTTLALLRRQFWLVKTQRIAVRRVTRSCLTCLRQNAKPFKYPPPPPLPETRTQGFRPFLHCGLDYAGPFPVRLVKGTSVEEEGKAWILLITCLATRAVHLELVLNNGTSEFILGLNKFFNRFGTPNSFYLDNAPTFKTGASVIHEYLNSQAKNEQLQIGSKLGDKAFKIDWHHITPYSPWKGGVYERMVAIVKTTLRKSLRNRILGFRALEAILLGVEDMVNHRPITKSSDDPRDRLALRPIDFIRPSFPNPFVLPPPSDDPDYSVSGIDSAASAKSYMDAISARIEDCWEHWRTLYISQLREKNKISQLSKGNPRSPQVGEIVLCVEDNQPRNKWKAATVLETITSEDGEIRTALIRNNNGREVLKSVKHLIPLEIPSFETPPQKKEVPPKTPNPPKASRPQRSTRKNVNYCENSKNTSD